MLFNSWQFLVFFPVVTILYFILPHRVRWAWLLAASCVFYMAFIPKYLLILFATIVIDYTAAIFIERTQGIRRKLFFIGSIVSTCLILFVFKYYDFFAINLTFISEIFDWNYSVEPLKLLLPIGLSFHTFQSLSYVIEVYRGQQKAERHFGIYALYVMFYPQLVAGPIERPQNLLHQFYEKHEFNYDEARKGLQLMAWGLFKKVVIADRLARIVSPIYDHPRQYAGSSFLLATLFFTFQIFCDFSGYSDIALGAAQVMGFKLMKNFDRPYASRTLAEFWKRWHISLSTWLRDYIYEPIAMNCRGWGTSGIVFALMVTFLISGFWHGASWTFLIWGLLHGLKLSSEVVFAKQRRKIAKRLPTWLFDFLSLALTFAFVNFTYIFFRAKTVDDAIYIAGNLTTGLIPVSAVENYGRPSSITNMQMQVCVKLILLVIAVHTIQARWGSIRDIFARFPWWVRWPIYQAIPVFMVIFGVWFEKRGFIYFQF